VAQHSRQSTICFNILVQGAKIRSRRQDASEMVCERSERLRCETPRRHCGRISDPGRESETKWLRNGRPASTSVVTPEQYGAQRPQDSMH